MLSLRALKREAGKRAGWGTNEVNSFVPPAPAEASTKENARVGKAVKAVSEPKGVSTRYPQVETEKVVRRECGEGGKALEKGEVVEIRKKGKNQGAMVEKNELYEEGCREILTTEELKSSEEDDLWSNVDCLEDAMLELELPEQLSSVSPEIGPSPEVALDKGTEEIQGENESRETEVERNQREHRDGREKSDEREESVEGEKSVEREIDEDLDLVAGLCGENRNFIAVQLGGQTYKALFDPGAMLSLIGPRVAERFEDRLEDSSTAALPKPLPMKALHNLDQEIILEMNFGKLYDVNAQLGRGVWRVRERRWRRFAKTGEEERAVIHAGSAGISELMEGVKRGSPP